MDDFTRSRQEGKKLTYPNSKSTHLDTLHQFSDLWKPKCVWTTDTSRISASSQRWFQISPARNSINREAESCLISNTMSNIYFIKWSSINKLCTWLNQKRLFSGCDIMKTEVAVVTNPPYIPNYADMGQLMFTKYSLNNIQAWNCFRI